MSVMDYLAQYLNKEDDEILSESLKYKTRHEKAMENRRRKVTSLGELLEEALDEFSEYIEDSLENG